MGRPPKRLRRLDIEDGPALGITEQYDELPDAEREEIDRLERFASLPRYPP